MPEPREPEQPPTEQSSPQEPSNAEPNKAEQSNTRLWQAHTPDDDAPIKPKSKPRIWIPIATLLVIAAAAFGGWKLWQSTHQPVVTTAPVIEAPKAGQITLTGNVMPRDAVPVASPLEGVLEVMEVPLGAEVLMGQMIGRVANQRLIDSNQSAEEQLKVSEERVTNIEELLTSARLESARATAEASALEGEMNRTKAAADRQELLFKEGATARKTYEQAKKEAAAAQSEYGILRESARAAEERTKTLTNDLEAAKKSVEDRTKALDESAQNMRTGEVISPIDGVLVAARALPGDPVPAGTTDLFHVAPSALKLSVALEPAPSTEALLRDGALVDVILAELVDAPLPGRLIKMPDGRWEVQFDTTENLWKPAQQATVRIHTQ